MGPACRYWANICFECVYFAGLSLFALLALATRQQVGLELEPSSRVVARAAHVAILLWVLRRWTFTSAGPSGGVLYPWVISRFRGFPVWTSADQWVLEHFPKVLEPLSQTLGPWLVISGTGTLGPVIAVAFGPLIGGFVFLGFKCLAGKVKLNKVADGDGASHRNRIGVPHGDSDRTQPTRPDVTFDLPKSP